MATGTLKFVSATRLTRAAFERESMLCRSLLAASAYAPIELRLFEENRQPLAVCYNTAIAESRSEDTLVFIHDDVWIDDWLISLRLQEALAQFDVVGVAGNRRRTFSQEAWWWNSETSAMDMESLSGAVGHREAGESRLAVDVFGPAPAQVKLIDGLMIAARAGTLQKAGVQFDADMAFHFYDLDFCRSCERAGLRIGTWPIALTHASRGRGVRSAAWQVAREVYLRKWG